MHENRIATASKPHDMQNGRGEALTAVKLFQDNALCRKTQGDFMHTMHSRFGKTRRAAPLTATRKRLAHNRLGQRGDFEASAPHFTAILHPAERDEQLAPGRQRRHHPERV
jgi:hypothetical protein